MVINRLVETIRVAGLQVVPSFDLQVAISPHSHCSCPHHGTDLCDCQMIVLLVYSQDDHPVSLVAHGKDGKTHIGLINNPGHGGAEEIETIVRSSFGSSVVDIFGQTR
jgi:hypothetical protein